MTPLRRYFGFLPMTVVLGITAGGESASPAPRMDEKTLRVGLPFLFTNQPADPAKGGGFQLIADGLAETLFKLGHDLRPVPWLATAARQRDEHTWEITLRPGVKFHNGALMDAAAVKASLERAVAMSPTAKAVLDIAHIDVKDPLTLIMGTNGPSPILLGLLTEPTTAIVDAAAAGAMREAFRKARADRPLQGGALPARHGVRGRAPSGVLGAFTRRRPGDLQLSPRQPEPGTGPPEWRD